MTSPLKPTQILFLDHAPILGGAEVVLLNVLDVLDRERFQPIVATTPQSPLVTALQARKIESLLVPLERLNQAGMLMPWHLARSVIAVARLLHARQIKLVHTNTVRSHIVGSLAGALTRTPVVWMLHDNTLPLGLARQLGRMPRRVIAVSNWLSDWYAPAGIAHKTIVIPNGIAPHITERLPNVRDELHIPSDAPLVVNVGRLVERKAPHLFVQAAQRIADEIPNAHFILVGGPDELEPNQTPAPYPAQLEQIIQASKLGTRLHPVGKQDDPMRFFAAADLVVQCVLEPEGFGMVLIEAMRAGKPVIASRIGATPEIVQDGITGLLVLPGDVQSLAMAMQTLLHDSKRAQAMGNAGRVWFVQKFDIVNQVRQIENIYTQILDEHHP